MGVMITQVLCKNNPFHILLFNVCQKDNCTLCSTILLNEEAEVSGV